MFSNSAIVVFGALRVKYVVTLSNCRTGWPPGILEHAPQSEHLHEFVNRQSNIAHIRVHSTHTQFA